MKRVKLKVYYVRRYQRHGTNQYNQQQHLDDCLLARYNHLNILRTVYTSNDAIRNHVVDGILNCLTLNILIVGLRSLFPLLYNNLK